ncbi:NACHT, LRR and PYD domains-containing protein 3-like [Erpetoichthys calabaricus]|uniref:NACHT, LRR and PYD domains-containing protein 3-like n=1 Tax=Erpetoichthys calabaricus TaxID=27687 RepID=UPI00223412A6|nr:NACHT, LRR and PYD domains-containing protein 3-like [Erpetoichthys calabaricus]
MDIQDNLQTPPIEAHIKDLHETHKAGVLESTQTLEDQAFSGDPHTRAVDFETQYMDLMLTGQYKRTYNKRHHELLNIGRIHEEMVKKQTREKCKGNWTEKLFNRGFESETDSHITVVSGVAGIGKTTMVQKIMFDWARGTRYQMFTFVFLFKFRELNLLDYENEPQMPLTRLIVKHYEYLNDPRLREIFQKPESLLFILDGLDEYKHKPEHTHEQLCSDPDEHVPVHILLTSLVRRTLLKGCSVLITSRPIALQALVMDRVDRFAQILGFFPEERLMYFKKFFGDIELSMKVFQYVEENAILYAMCFNPSYCWIICSVLKSHFMTPEDERGAAPRTLTEVYVMLIRNILTNHKGEAKDQRGLLVNLGKMAYYGLANRILVFNDTFEMSSFGVHPVLPSQVLSGLLKEIPPRERTMDHTMYTFYHLTIQEFIAACSFYLDPSADIEELLKKLDSCKEGRFEILTRFLAGLGRSSVFVSLGGILGDFEMKTVKRILEWVKKNAKWLLQSADKSEALRVCQWLYEAQNEKLIRDTMEKDLKMDFSYTTLSPLDCAVLGYVICCCGELEELNLTGTKLTPECIKRLAPGLSCCRCVRLSDCALIPTCSSAIFLALSSPNSRLSELELNYNKMKNAGVAQVFKGLRSEHCKLEKLSLRTCHLNFRCCAALSLALSSPHTLLTELDLNGQELKDSGVEKLCEGLRSENCKLEKLSLSYCCLTHGCCSALSSVLSSPNSRLTELKLNHNFNMDSGLAQLCDGLKSKNCKLKKLELQHVGISESEKRNLRSLQEELERTGQQVDIVT